MSTPAARGLTAAELALAIEDLRVYRSATVLDAVALNGTGGHDDLLLVLQPVDESRKAFLQIALGGQRARITTTKRRFGRTARRRGPGADLLHRELLDATLSAINATSGERSCVLVFSSQAGERRLIVELFGARGLWVLTDQDNLALTMSRSVQTAVRTLGRGDIYSPPPQLPTSANVTKTAKLEVVPRFPAPVLTSIDDHFTTLDLEKEQLEVETSLRLLVQRNLKKAEHKVQGMHRQLDNVGRATEMRSTADLMLAYAHSVARGAEQMEVPNLNGDGTMKIPLDPSKPVALQANKLYDKARRLDEGRTMTVSRLKVAETELAALSAAADLLQDPSEANLDAVRTRLDGLGLLPKPKADKSNANTSKKKKNGEAVPFRRFTSAEGYPIFVGRNNNQNDELTMRYANGNDLWLHVGGGRPGSHVVIRMPKQKTASLETLLDAATLAVYYSKSRGEDRLEVVYTFRKNIKKPKGLPPGAVVPAQTKAITVFADKDRLARLLNSSTKSQD